MPRGRPTKCKPEFCDQVVALMGEGLSLTAAAAELGLTRECCYQWAYPSAALVIGEQTGTAKSDTPVKLRSLLNWRRESLPRAA